MHVEFKFLEFFRRVQFYQCFFVAVKKKKSNQTGNNDPLILLFEKKFLELIHLESTLKMKNLETDESMKKSR